MPPLPKEVSTAVYKRDGWRCRHCNNRNGLHPHHVCYQSHGGTDTPDNLITLCAACHRGHHDGFLGIRVIERTLNDVKVQFTRKGRWKPT